MQAYQVGGGVRDRLLGLPTHDADWVVVGSTPAAMLARGFRQVGADFPVFLHPETGSEYALARTERKISPGHKGFVTHSDPAVTLAEDLCRRDLTINAMAWDATTGLVDPYGGQRDLAARVLRHVSPTFADDPLRVLRVARFAARFATLGFQVAPETLQRMRALAHSGELASLTPERVWQETVKALATEAPATYLRVLDACGALRVVFPELSALQGQTQPPQHHPEGDAWEHTLLVLEQISRMSSEPVVRFAALVHDLGKGETPPSLLPRHHGHEERGIGCVERLCQRLRIPGDFQRMGMMTAGLHGRVHRACEMQPKTMVRLLADADAFRNPARFGGILLACEADARGRGGYADVAYPQARLLRSALSTCLTVDTAPLLERGLTGKSLGNAIRQERVQRVRHLVASPAGAGVDQSSFSGKN
ncbi:MAG: multifunctional CCA addition/repair protein [Magnetococcales bacterium]|nr:multifunctional CCA addition/repair protein [Magnetococcales bacterium]